MSYLDASFVDSTFMLQTKHTKTLMDTISVCGTKTGNMFLFGGTIGRSQYPKFFDGQRYKMLPRPVVKSKVNTTGYWMMRTQWFTSLCLCIEKFVSKFVNDKIDQHVTKFIEIKEEIGTCKRIVPSDLRICNSFFTSVSVIFDKNRKVRYVHAHMDRNDVISCTLYLGSNVSGGSLVFYDGLSEKNTGDCVHIKDFIHGRLITGEFKNILHGASNWTGHRIVIVFYTNRKIMKHFRSYGDMYYRKYKTLGCPKNYIDDDQNK